MARYCYGWSLVATVLAVLGFAAGLMLWSLSGVLFVVVSVTTFVALLLLVNADPEERATRRRPPIQVLRIALACALGLVCVLGPVSVAGWPWLLLCAILAATSPPALRLLHRRLSRPTLDPSADAQATPRTDEAVNALVKASVAAGSQITAAQLSDLDARTLCRVWRRSGAALRQRAGAAQQLQLVALREQLLAELGRRHPDRLQAWLASGAVDDPDRYLVGR